MGTLTVICGQRPLALLELAQRLARDSTQSDFIQNVRKGRIALPPDAAHDAADEVEVAPRRALKGKAAVELDGWKLEEVPHGNDLDAAHGIRVEERLAVHLGASAFGERG